MAVATTETTGFTGEAKALASAVDTVASFVSRFEPGRYSVSDAASLVSLFERGKRLCGAGETLSASRAAEGNAHSLSGHRTPDEWLSSVTGASKGEALGILKVGEALCSAAPRLRRPSGAGSSPPPRRRWCPTRSRSTRTSRRTWSRGHRRTRCTS